MAILAVCTLLLLLWKTAEGPKNSQEEHNEALAYGSGQVKQPTTKTKNIPVFPRVANSLTPSPSPQKSNDVWETALTHWQAPIEFYGITVDENSNAVSGVSIHFRWIETPAEDGERMGNTLSDSNGLFSLHGKRGRSLTVWFSKEGYLSSNRGQRGFLYALGRDIYSPDPQNPVIFLLHKKGRGAELITSENGMRSKLDVRIPKDGTPVRVKLLQEEPSAEGLLEISQNKPPWQEATNWSFRMSIPSGGLVENQDEFQFEAPEADYQPSIEYQFRKTETNWTTQVKKQFYIVFGQPRKYGWVRIESNLMQETVFLTYAINPTGSRDLEPKE